MSEPSGSAARKHEAGASNRKKKRKFFHGLQKGDLHSGPGLAGILITTQQKRERDAARDAVDVFSEMLEENDPAQKEPQDEEDVASALESELKELKSREKHAVTAIDIECKGLLFLRITKGDPLDLVTRLIQRVRNTGQSPSRHCIRYIPILATCFASAEDIGRHAKRVLQPYLFDESIPMRKYSILFTRRNNTTLSREKCIESIEVHIGQRHIVDLRDPDIVIFLEVFKSTCAIGVGTEYFANAKYNLHTLATNVAK